jgi:hypothetical protein
MGAIGMSQGELITSGGNTWVSPLKAPQATVSSTDSTDFLHVALEVNGYSTDRRYPQVIVSDHWENGVQSSSPFLPGHSLVFRPRASRYG